MYVHTVSAFCVEMAKSKLGLNICLFLKIYYLSSQEALSFLFSPLPSMEFLKD